MKPLKLEGVGYSRNGHPLLSNIHLEVRAKQVTGILADNQERLDLLLAVLAGSLHQDSGTITLMGKDLKPRERLRHIGIAQEPGTLVDKMSVLDNLFLSTSSRFARFGLLNKKQMEARAREILKRIGALVPLDLPLAKLEPEMRVMVDIARVLAMEPDCLVFNGVTRGMSLRQYDSFLNLVKELRSQGLAILFVPLNVEDIRHFVDRLHFLKNGQLFEIENCAELSDDELNDFLLSPGKRHFKAANDPIQRALEILDLAVQDRDLDFQKVAETVAMSYDNFRRRFKLKVGLSPNQYVLKGKVELAKELLLYTDMDIKDVASQLGFPDPYYFSRVFKEREGLSPGQFRGSRNSGTSP